MKNIATEDGMMPPRPSPMTHGTLRRGDVLTPPRPYQARTAVWFLVLAVLLCQACVSARSSDAASIRDSDESQVVGCEFLGHLSGSSMLGGAVQARARENAKTAALEQAAKLGATHVVWSSVASTVMNGASAQGRAYRCGSDATKEHP